MVLKPGHFTCYEDLSWVVSVTVLIMKKARSNLVESRSPKKVSNSIKGLTSTTTKTKRRESSTYLNKMQQYKAEEEQEYFPNDTCSVCH